MAPSISGGVQQGLEVVPRPELAQVTVGARAIASSEAGTSIAMILHKSNKRR